MHKLKLQVIPSLLQVSLCLNQNNNFLKPNILFQSRLDKFQKKHNE